MTTGHWFLFFLHSFLWSAAPVTGQDKLEPLLSPVRDKWPPSWQGVIIRRLINIRSGFWGEILNLTQLEETQGRQTSAEFLFCLSKTQHFVQTKSLHFSQCLPPPPIRGAFHFDSQKYLVQECAGIKSSPSAKELLTLWFWSGGAFQLEILKLLKIIFIFPCREERKVDFLRKKSKNM